MNTIARPHRCTALALALATGLMLAGCASPTAAPPMLYLPTSAPAGAQAGATQHGATSTADWRLVTPITLPAALDREAVMVATAPGQWQAWRGLRWAEPLRDALPRVLAADLGLLRQAPVWTGSAAPGVVPARELRVAIDDWEAALPSGQVSAQVPAQVAMRAHWTLSAPDGRSAALRGVVSVRQPWRAATPEALVQAQRAALQALAAGIVDQAAAEAARASRSTSPP